MNASLYICDKSFAYNGTDKLSDIYVKIISLNGMIGYIKSFGSENQLFVNSNNFLDTIIFDGCTIKDIIFKNGNFKCNRDVENILRSIITNYSTHSSFNYEDMLECLSDEYEDENNCNGLIVFNIIDTISKKNQILCTKDDFLRFRRYFVGKLVKDPEYFSMQIERYYDNLILNQDHAFFCGELSKVIEVYGNGIIHCLNVLNDFFLEEFRKECGLKAVNISPFLRSFAHNHSVRDASTEGKHKKESLNCSFRLNKEPNCNKVFSRYCGAHLKMYKDDVGEKNHMRVYFAWNEDSDYVYIGMITSHVE
jgi:hypothetical protein